METSAGESSGYRKNTHLFSIETEILLLQNLLYLTKSHVTAICLKLWDCIEFFHSIQCRNIIFQPFLLVIIKKKIQSTVCFSLTNQPTKAQSNITTRSVNVDIKNIYLHIRGAIYNSHI